MINISKYERENERMRIEIEIEREYRDFGLSNVLIVLIGFGE
jgi:hypothetical protein